MNPRWTSPSALAPALFAFMPAVVAVMACGGSTDSPAASDGGGADAVATPGERDSRATVPVVELNETGPAAPTGPVMCSGTMCSAPSGGMIPLVACCLPDNTCGLTFDLSQFGGAIPGGSPDGGLGCLDTAPGTSDPSCPSQSMAGFMMAGCCSRSGVCGVDLSMLSMGALGCNSQLPFPGLGMGQSMSAQPQPCAGQAGDSGPGPHDAGAMAHDASNSPQDGSSSAADATHE
jgi:hypothetical protein